MIIPLNIKSENTYYKIFEAVKIAFTKLSPNNQNTKGKRGTYMVCKIKCAAITGIDTQPVIVETDICNGLPSFDMVGLLASNIKESRERVRTAIKNSGFMIPPKRITINFSPAII